MVIPPHTVHRALVKDIDQYERILIYINPHLLLDFQYSSLVLKENITFQKTNGNYMYHLDSKSFQNVISLLNEIIKKIEEGKYIYSFMRTCSPPTSSCSIIILITIAIMFRDR